MNDNNIQFTWIPFYMELADALLAYKNRRTELVEWIYTELSKIKGVGGKPLIDYLHEKDGTHITDIDPFSVFAIFNRATSSRSLFLETFKSKFELSSSIPSDFDGIPVVDARRSFFFSWEADNHERIETIWTLFEKVLHEENFSKEFDYLIAQPGLSYGITMCLFWIRPYTFISLDSRNREYLKSVGLNIKTMPNYDSYMVLTNQIKQKMQAGTIPYTSFPELSFKVWQGNGANSKIWIWSVGKPSDVVSKDYIEAGSDGKDIGDFSLFKSSKEIKEAFIAIQGKHNDRVSNAYWQFMHEVSIGDIIVINNNVSVKGNRYQHNLYGWGEVVSDCDYIHQGENRIRRKVKWHLPILVKPVIADKMTNNIFFHGTSPEEAEQVKEILLTNSKCEIMANRLQKYIDLLKANHNIIFNGAPGTGKTFLAKKIAEKMNATVKMVQFHPSYDYTDFVEGLRPIKDEKGNICFERKDGVFKEFCRKALLVSETSSNEDLFSDLNDNPTVWKVSLGGTGDNPIRTDCLENGWIRIGWNSYGDVEDFNDFEDFKDGGKVILRAFQHTMQIGDIVLSCYSEKEIDAVGIVTGNYEFHNNVSDFQRYRKVRWIVTGIKEDIRSLNRNKVMTLSTIYKLPIKVTDIVEIVNRHSQSLASKPIAEVDNASPFVFIIDEINRGEISKIFGELFYSIDPGYRGEKGKVQTQYQNLVEDGDVFKDGFYVPENVYIIGTMNDIDRSVESMDFAMRRRFAWQEITAEESAQNMGIEGELLERMERLNAVILETEGLGSSYQVGASMFLKVKEGDMTEEQLWNLNLKSLMKEYLRGLPQAEETLDKMKEAYFLESDSEDGEHTDEDVSDE